MPMYVPATVMTTQYGQVQRQVAVTRRFIVPVTVRAGSVPTPPPGPAAWPQR
jgi:hypothetical protein